MTDVNTNDEWQEAGSASGNMWDENSGPITGRYTKQKTDVGPNNSNQYFLTQDSGEDIGVWGSTVLDTKFQDVPLNALVKIEFLGKVAAKTGRGQYKDYKVMFKLDDIAKASQTMGGGQPV